MTITGRRWRRSPRTCPDWCARDHQCTAQHGYPAGEHRSDPLRLDEHDLLSGRRRRLPYGTLIATRIEDLNGRGRLEVRSSVRLAADEELARRQSQHLLVQIDLAIREVLGLPVMPGAPNRPAMNHPARPELLARPHPGVVRRG